VPRNIDPGQGNLTVPKRIETQGEVNFGKPRNRGAVDIQDRGVLGVEIEIALLYIQAQNEFFNLGLVAHFRIGKNRFNVRDQGMKVQRPLRQTPSEQEDEQDEEEG
jgi:hypothetical protein